MNAKANLLVVDDDASVRAMLLEYLGGHGYDVRAAADGAAMRRELERELPDLVLLDLRLPGEDGLTLARFLREHYDVAIVMVTGSADVVDRVVGLEVGADDYIVKPFKPKELVARMHARLRRNKAPTSEVLDIGDLTIDVAGHVVSRQGEPIGLTPLEFDLLAALARKPGQVFTREHLLEQVWGYRHAADTRLVNVHVQRLRAKIERDPERPEIVLTVRGVGYKAGPP